MAAAPAGAARLRAPAADGRAEPQEPEVVRLLTWNVQWCRGLDGVVDPARIAREARRIADPEVLCLQEINVGFTDLPGSRGENQVEALRRELAGYQLFYAAAVDVPRRDGLRQRFGNVIAS